MANTDSAFVESQVDLPDQKIPVTVSLESNGVSFNAFEMDLVMDDTIVKNIKSGGTEEDLGQQFPLGNALALRGLVFVCRGYVGAAVAGPIRLQCFFRFAGSQLASKEAVANLTATSSSAPYRIRCEFV
jgi:hypothetical protein